MLPGFLPAQSSFFTAHDPNAVNLSQADEARYQALLGNSFTSDVTIVSTPDLRDWQEDGRLVFLLPGSSDTLIAEADLVDENDHVGFRWSGKLINAPGYVNFDIREGVTGGYLMVGPDFYELIPVNTNYQFLVQRAKGVGEGCGDTIVPPSDITPSPPDQCDYEPDYDDCPALITVLVIVTPEAEAELADTWHGLDLFVRFGEAMTNQAFYNSDIPNKEIRVKYILKSGFEFHPNQDQDEDLDYLATWSDTVREDHKADLVVLLTGEVYDDAGGVATVVGAPDFDMAFAIVEAQWYISLGAFSHEVGHLFGCRHNWPLNLGNDPEEVCAHGFRHLDVVEPPFGDYLIYSWRTLMGVPVFWEQVILEIDEEEHLYDWFESWILHYSNPEVAYQGDPTGKASGWIADNAQQIRNTGCAVADFYPAQELAVFATYSPDDCNETRTFNALILPPESGLPGVAPYTVTWQWNTTGVFNHPNQGTQSLGTGASITVTDPACPRYYVKCTVESDDQVTVSRILKVDLGAPECCEETYPGGGGGHGRPGYDGGNFPVKNKHGRVYPNPLAGRTLYVEQGDEPARAFELFDQFGRTLSAGSIPIAKTPVGVIGLPETLPAGACYLRLRTESGVVETHKVFIIKS